MDPRRLRDEIMNDSSVKRSPARSPNARIYTPRQMFGRNPPPPGVPAKGKPRTPATSAAAVYREEAQEETRLRDAATRVGGAMFPSRTLPPYAFQEEQHDLEGPRSSLEEEEVKGGRSFDHLSALGDFSRRRRESPRS